MSPILILALAFQSLPATGEPYFLSAESEASLTRQYDDCVAKNVHASDAWEVSCLRREHARQDAKLNQSYQRAMRRLSPPKARALRQQELRWIRYRDEHCDRIGGGPWGGTMGDVNLHTCLLDETIRRTTWLKQYR